ncbi:MAG: tail fiber protein [Peptostreptococcaceae bacterium]
MAISRELIVTVKEDTATLNEKIIVYENDKGIDLFFTIKDNKYKYVKDNSMLKNIDNTFVNITVVKPDNTELTVPSYVENNKVKFTITQDLTDEFTEIGTYQLQFHITDNDCCEFTIPPISFEVKERLKGIKENGTVDNAKVDIDTVAEELFNIIDGKIVLVWKSGDLITAKKLNDMVNSINNKSNLEHTHNELHIHSNKVTIDKLTDIKIQEWDNKSNFNGDYNSLNNKPNIPSVDGLASEIYVNNKIASKVDKTEGKGLSSNDFTNTYKTKLDNLNNYTHPNDSNTRHVSDTDKSRWDNKSNFDGDYRNLSNTPSIPSISGLATETFVNSELSKKSDKTHNHNSEYATKSSEHNHVNKLVIDNITSVKVEEWDNKSDFDGNYNSLVGLPSIPNVDVDKNYVDSELRKKSNTNHSHNELHTHNNKEVIDAITNAKINEWNGKSNFDGNYNSLTNKPSIATKTSQLANDSKFTNEDFVTNKIAEASLGGGEIDLSGYATKEDLSKKSDNTHNHNDSYASKSSEHTHSNKTSLDKINDSKITSWDNKSNFSGNYSDLSGKPTIPSISGLATETFVNNGLSGKANSEHTHSKSSITDFAHRHDASEIDNLSSGDVSISGNNTFTGVNTFTNTMVVEKDDEVSKMMPSTASNACYYAFYKDKTNRSGYFGYESASTSNFVIANEANNADMNFKTKGSGKVKINNNNILSSSDISSSTNSTSETSVASSNAVKIAYDKGAEALNTANTKANSSHTHTKANITDFSHRHNASDIDNLTIVSNASGVSYNKNECANVDIALDKLFTELNGQRVRGINISNKLLDMLI